jgi:hypothetical protein
MLPLLLLVAGFVLLLLLLLLLLWWMPGHPLLFCWATCSASAAAAAGVRPLLALGERLLHLSKLLQQTHAVMLLLTLECG